MTRSAGLEHVSRTILHEGTLLYPYGPGALKNRNRYAFGEVFPVAVARALGSASDLETGLLVAVVDGTSFSLTCWLRCLVAVPGQTPRLAEHELSVFLGPGIEEAQGTLSVGTVLGRLTVGSEGLRPGLSKVTANVANLSSCTAQSRDDALAYAMFSTQIMLRVHGGCFLSATSPPQELVPYAEANEQRGLWPALVGDRHAPVEALAAPIILPDFPAVAPETRGEFCDSLEIDAMLRLRVQTLSPLERAELARELRTGCSPLDASAADEPSYRLLQGRTTLGPAGKLTAGTRVRLRPHRGRDSLDLVLGGMTAVIRRIETDFTGRCHCVVSVEDDPGADLGRFGHEFFFSPEELEPLPAVPAMDDSRGQI